MTAPAITATAVPRFDRHEGAALQRVEYRRMARQLRGLDAAAWSAPTDCPEWTVRDMAAHVLGGLEGNASPREGAHQMWVAWRSDRTFVDGLGVVQIRDRAGVAPVEILRRFEAVIDRAVRARERMPAALRALPLRFTAPSGVERMRLRDLLDTVYLRDAWMHRVDIARAAGTSLELTADHDGRIVADVVGEWARRHGQPFRLDLDGPAGGRFAEGDGGEDVHLDAVEFCRIVSGRAPGPGLLTQEVVF
ncbi:MAG: maleylpyruvate isomerase family mycothiol-dependent enzyme [Acidimicrobiia bacterium]|jgi:uncharacterized protein (TIGR03083 family)